MSLNKLWNMITQALMLLPVLLVISLTSIVWYVFVLVFQTTRLSSPSPANRLWALFSILLFTALVLLQLLSYIRTVTTSNALHLYPPPPSLQLHTCKTCPRCDLLRPARTHHCSICGHCVLRMDHHCPWVNNCVGLLNYKFFILFLFYTAVGCMFYFVATLDMLFPILLQKRPDSFLILLATIIAAAFAIALLPFLLFHLHLAQSASTTLEYGYLDSSAHSHGSAWLNLRHVLGNNPWTWIIPVRDYLDPWANPIVARSRSSSSDSLNHML